MDFCIISPTSGLERYARLSKTHLVLAHMYNNDSCYRSFYNNRREEGDFIILDNGAYENRTIEVIPHDYPNLRPNVVVLPDYLLQPWRKTWHAAIAHLDRWYNCSPNCEWLYIPQAEKGDLNGFIESYIEATLDPRISWIGIPRALAYAVTSNPLARVQFARIVKRDHPDLHLHAFGMVNGNVHELPHLADAGVRSVDSSAPVWRGWHSIQIDDPIDRTQWDATGVPVDFSNPEPLDGWEQVCNDVIKHNLEVCGVNTNSSPT